MKRESPEEYFEDGNEKGSKLKRILIISASVIVLIVFLIYIFSNSVGFDILSSLISSSSLNENEIDFSFNGKIIFEDAVLKELKSVYFDNLRNEFKVCLHGRKEDETYFINKLAVPKTYSKSFNQVVAEPCSSEALVSLHSHPYKRCLPSEQDFETFSKFKERNADALMVVMCKENQFGVYE